MLGENFIFDGISSSNFNVKIIRTSGGGFLTEETIGSANLTEIEHPGDFKPHLQKITRSPLEFSRQIALLDEYDQPKRWTDLDRQLIFGWLFHNEYKPLIFSDRPDIVYNVIAVSNLSLNTINETGYLDITFKSNSPYPWKKEREIFITGSETVEPSETIVIDNSIAIDKIFPKILLTRMDGAILPTTVKAWSSTLGPSLQIGLNTEPLSGVNNILINSRYRIIINDDTKESLYKYKGTSGFEFPYFVKGSNTLTVSKGWDAKVIFQEPILY